MLLQLEKKSAPNTYIDTTNQALISRKYVNLAKNKKIKISMVAPSSADNKKKSIKRKIAN